jgi:MtrB/PioB family decaheme-associated outer membrane protein
MILMTKYRIQISCLSCLLISSSLYYPTAHAQDSSEQTLSDPGLIGHGQACELCASSAGWELDISLGPAYVSDDSFRFGDYTGLENKGFYLFGDVFARHWGENAEFIRLDAYRLGTDSRALFIEGGKQGLYKLRASYQGIPRRIYDTTFTPYQSDGSSLRLPSDWVRAPSTQGMTQLDSSLKQVKIKRDWDIYNAGIEFTPASHWKFDVNFKRQERSGNTISSGAFFLDAVEFSSPVKDSSNEMEASIAYSEKTWQASLNFTGSFFSNDNANIELDNPYSAQTAGADTGNLALAPNNDAQQISLAASMTLPAQTMISGLISLGRMSQDETLQAYTSNTSIATAALPRSSANTEVETTLINLRLVSSPFKKFTFQGKLQYDERDNKTPEDVFEYVVTDLFVSPTSSSNKAYDYKRTGLGLSGKYRLPARTSISAGYDYERNKRSHQARDETTTNNLWTKLRSRAIDATNMSIKLYVEGRDGSDYNASNAASPENPLMRQFNLANRKRKGVLANINSYASERLNVGFEVEYNNDDYDDSQIGLLKSRYQRYGFDASYLFQKNVSIFGSFYNENIESRQAGSQLFTDPDWLGETDDTFKTSSVGIQYPKIVGRLDATLEYSVAKSNGGISNNTSGLESDFPALQSKLQQIKLGLTYPYNKSLSIGFNYMFEKFKAHDWALEGIEADTVPNLLSLGADPYDYDVHVFYLNLRYVFDTRN